MLLLISNISEYGILCVKIVLPSDVIAIIIVVAAIAAQCRMNSVCARAFRALVIKVPCGARSSMPRTMAATAVESSAAFLHDMFAGQAPAQSSVESTKSM